MEKLDSVYQEFGEIPLGPGLSRWTSFHNDFSLILTSWSGIMNPYQGARGHGG